MDALQKESYEKLGLNIAYYRKLKNYTQKELCDLLGVNKGYISKIELGSVGVSLDIVFKIANVLSVPVGKLFELI